MSHDSSLKRSQAYTDSGVSITAGYELVSSIKKMVADTKIPGVLSDIGGFGGLFQPNISGMKEPVLVSSTDGVGTKLKLAFMFNKHNTIGIDLVAMSVNDIIVQGASPLFFLDYFACGKLKVEVASSVVSGVTEGCKLSHCALLGGETAEMPGMYADGEYDLAGFCVGMVDKSKLIDGSTIADGDALIGLASSGVHSNGYSLVRRLFDKSKLSKDDTFPGTDEKVEDVILRPTTIYVDAVNAVMSEFKIKGMSHITGGGFYENLPRMLPKGAGLDINFKSWEILPIFEWLKSIGELSWEEMLQIFNCGIGLAMVVSKDDAENVCKKLSTVGQKAWVIGKVTNKINDEAIKINF